MTRRRLYLVGIAAVLVSLVAAAAIVVHLPAVQRAVWHRVADAIERTSGLRIDVEAFAVRALPARLEAQRVTVAADGRDVATVDHLSARWQWRRLLDDPRRLDEVVLDGVSVDFDALPTGKTAAKNSDASMLESFEIGELRLIAGGGSASITGIQAGIVGVTIAAQLQNGLAVGKISARELSLTQADRRLVVGPLELVGSGSVDGVSVDRLAVEGSAASLKADGRLNFAQEITGVLNLEISADLAVLAGWWDPNLASGLDPSGRLDLVGDIELTADRGPLVELRHRGGTLRVAGYNLDTVGFVYAGQRPTLHVGHPGWGDASMTLLSAGTAEVTAHLNDAPADRPLSFMAPRVAGLLGSPVTLTGDVDAIASFPVDLDQLSGRVDLVLRWPDGRIAVRGNGTGAHWEVAKLDAEAAGATLRAKGWADLEHGVNVDAVLTAAQPRQVVDAVAEWMPGLRGADIGGGPLAVGLRIDGPFNAPNLQATATWSGPFFFGRRFDEISLEASGTADAVEWDLGIIVIPGSSVTASGTAYPRDGRVDGAWRVDVSDVAELTEAQGIALEPPVHGRLTGDGTAGLSAGDVRIAGVVEAEALTVGEWTIDRLRGVFETRADTVEVRTLEAEAFGGQITGSMVMPWTSLDHHFRVDLVWNGVDLRAMPIELPEPGVGVVAGRLGLGGRVSEPQGELDLEWQSAGSPAPIDEIRLHAALADGTLRIATDRMDSAGGPLFAEATLPLGGFVRPEWLWPDAPAGPVRATVSAPGFRSGPMMDAVGREDLPVAAEADLRAEVEWDPGGQLRPRVMVEADGLRVLYDTGELVADGPLVATLDGGRLELAPVVLVGRNSRIEASAVYDPATVLVTGRVRARLAPELSRLLPVPLNVTGPLTIDADLEAPADAPLALESVRGTLAIDHRNGTMTMRDPPVEIRGLRLVATLDDGVLNIEEGRAEVNRGQVLIGGGWDPESGQGLVLELDGVTALMAGILTKWDGSLAVEPHPEQLAVVVGDLNLVAGLWDESFDVAGAVLGGDETELASDDPLHDIGLDLTVRGRAGIRVENNLGRFNVNWDVLRIGGTAAEPSLRGAVRIAPGGVLTLAGQEVRVRRGSVEFAGDPATDTVMAIVPESDTTLFGGGSGESFDAAALATESLARGITSALGFENETLRPAEIATQTEKDPSVRFMVGQRLSRSLALFLATNLTDVQDHMTMLQFWNLPRFKGLAVQAYQETADDNFGANLFQRFEWGGTENSDGRPEIHRLRLEGDWPMSTRTLRKATRLRRGQPYDGFLLFVGAVRMERVLAEHGYQNARVTGVQTGPPSLPTLVFTCDPGEEQRVEFVGDSVPKRIRREVTALYQAPPLEASALENMRLLIERSLTGSGYLRAKAAAERRDELIVVDVDRGEEVEVLGPFFAGAPVDAVGALLKNLGTSTALATAAARPDWAEKIVERTMKNAGYLQARVLDVSLDVVESKKAEIHISIDAGPLATVGSVVLVGSDPLGLTMDTGFRVVPGAALDREVIDSAMRDLRDGYVAAGYRDASARSSIHQDDSGGWVVEMHLAPGQRRVVREIRFAGRRDVSERVLRKGLTVEPGEVLTDAEVDRSASRIANFSPIERVDVRTVPVPGSRVDLDFDVVEKQRWKLEAGGGWSTERGFGVAFGARDDNLFGRGVGLNLRGSLDTTESRLFLIGSVPPVPGGRLSLITTVGYSTGDDPVDPDILNQDQKLASIEASYRLPKGVQLGTYYRLTVTRTYEKDPSDFFPIDSTIHIGTLGVRTVVDRFDYLFDPRRGWGLTSDFGWSGEAIGSDLYYASWLTGYSLALEPYRGATWMQAVRVGIAEPFKGTNLDRDARFYAGGQSSIRGFDLNSVGPVTFGVGGLVPAGGGALFVLNEELRIPIWDPLRLAVFADVGQVWESWRDADLSFAVGVGFGLRWSTPIGPLWADVAWPVADIGISSDKPKFYLGIGRPF